MSPNPILRILISLGVGCWLYGCGTAKDGSQSNLLKKNGPVTIEYIAHACFRVTSPAGKQILLDPYASRVWLGYDFPPNVRADAVLISHPHYDHDGGEAIKRPVLWTANTLVLRGPGTNRIGDVTVIGLAGKHADPWGKEFGQSNTIWLLEIGGTSSESLQSSGMDSGTPGTRPSNEDRARGIRIVHLGDNGPLRDDAIRQLGRVDVLMIPIDSQFHILKADEIAAIRKQVSPSILIPMHYRHDDLESVPGKPEALGGIEGWAKGQPDVRPLDTHTNAFSVGTLPRKPEVIIFKHSPLVKAP
jgi:L-ascorbate metabolism protein UlaG (beta-lactamase superfamily)